VGTLNRGASDLPPHDATEVFIRGRGSRKRESESREITDRVLELVVLKGSLTVTQRTVVEAAKHPGYVIGTNAQGVGEILQFTPGDTINQGVTQKLGTISNGRLLPNPAYDPNKRPSVTLPGGDSCDPEREDTPK
jgi:hypothetical protein